MGLVERYVYSRYMRCSRLVFTEYFRQVLQAGHSVLCLPGAVGEWLMHVCYIVMCVLLSRTVSYCSVWPSYYTVVLPCTQCRFLYSCLFSSDTIIMLGCGCCYTVFLCSSLNVRCASLPCFSAQPTLFLSRYANLYTFGLDAYWLTATYQLWARLQRHYWWEVCMCVFYLLCCGV